MYRDPRNPETRTQHLMILFTSLTTFMASACFFYGRTTLENLEIEFDNYRNYAITLKIFFIGLVNLAINVVLVTILEKLLTLSVPIQKLEPPTKYVNVFRNENKE